MKDSNSPIHRDPDKYIQELIFGDIFEGVGEKAVRTRQARTTTRSTNLSGLPSLPANLPEFRVIRSARRKRGISAIRQNGLIEIHIP